MADNVENVSASFSFGIEDTMEMGMGNADLIQGLLSPETSTSNPDDISPIKEEKKPKSPAPDEEEEKVKEKSSQNILDDFLKGDGDDDDDEEEDDKPKKTATSAKEEEEEDAASSQFNALAKDLVKLGVFTKDDEDDEEDISINTPEEFLDRFNSEKKKAAIEIVNNFIGQFGEDYQNAFDAIFVKGVPPSQYFNTYNTVVNFANMDLDDERNQEMVMKQSLADQGFEEEDIKTEIERLKNYGDLETTAAKHHKVLVKKEATKLQKMEERAQQELEQKAAIKQQYIQNVNTILEEKLKQKEFDGIPINPKLATELQDFLLVDRYKTASGETLTEFDRTILELKRPENHAIKVKLGLLLKIMEKDPSLSTIQRVGVTKKSNELFGEITKQKSKSPKQGSWFQ